MSFDYHDFKPWKLIHFSQEKIPSLKLTANAPENRHVYAPKGKDHLPTIHFQVHLLLVSGRVPSLALRDSGFWWHLPEKNRDIFFCFIGFYFFQKTNRPTHSKRRKKSGALQWPSNSWHSCLAHLRWSWDSRTAPLSLVGFYMWALLKV